MTHLGQDIEQISFPQKWHSIKENLICQGLVRTIYFFGTPLLEFGPQQVGHNKFYTKNFQWL